MFTILLFIFILGLLVLVHEWGHFFAARRAGMRVYEFGFGFPPRAFGMYKDKKGKWKFVWGRGKSNLRETVGGDERQAEYPSTLYSFNWLPLGGFVKIKGESGEDADEKDSFSYHPPFTRIVVLVAGVVMNVLLAALLLGIGFGIGLPADFTHGVDEKAIIVEQPSIVIQQIQDGSPADDVGLLFGDKIVGLDGNDAQGAIAMTQYVKEKGEQQLTLQILREGEKRDVVVTPRIEKEGDPARIGITLADAGIIRYPWYLALQKGIVSAVIGLINIFIAFWILLKGLILGQGMAFDVSGPVGIAVIIGQSARLGISHLMSVTAMISLSLAAINILPIPALDGGRTLFVILEKMLGRRLSMRYEQLAHTIGFVLLMILVIFVTYYDVIRLL